MAMVTAAAEARVGVAGNGGGAGSGWVVLAAAAAAAAAEGYGTKRAALATGAAHSRRPSLRVGALRPPVQRHTSARPSVCVLAEAARWSSCYSWPSTNLRILGRRPLRQEQQPVEVPGSSWIGHNTTMESKKLKVDDVLDEDPQHRRNLMAAAAEARLQTRGSPAAKRAAKSPWSGTASPAGQETASTIEESEQLQAPLHQPLALEQQSGQRDNVQPLSTHTYQGPYSMGSGNAQELLELVFGESPPQEVLHQWTSQGFRFSNHAETFMGLEQRQGGPCGVLAPVQAFVLKHLIFSGDGVPTISSLEDLGKVCEGKRDGALRSAIAEILLRAANAGKTSGDQRLNAKVAYLRDGFIDELDRQCDFIDRADGGSPTNGLSALCTQMTTPEGLDANVEVVEGKTMNEVIDLLYKHEKSLRSPLGSLLVLFSALISRGLHEVRQDRDAEDATGPLVTPQFGHSSQEIVSLLVCGRAVSNVFDGEVDLGDGMKLMGITEGVEVGFLTIHEALHYCSVGERLKRPRWPLWVVGSESHYTVLFALDSNVQEETSSESYERLARAVFDSHDKSGDGGFISADIIPSLMKDVVERGVLKKDQSATEIETRLQELANATSILIWSDFWSVIDGEAQQNEKESVFVLFHLNGIAKRGIIAGPNNGESGMETDEQQQRVALCELSVTVPPKWTPPRQDQMPLLLPAPPLPAGNGSANEGAVVNDTIGGEVGSTAESGPHGQDGPDQQLQAAIRLSMASSEALGRIDVMGSDVNAGIASKMEVIEEDDDLQKALKLSMEDIGGGEQMMEEDRQADTIAVSDSASPRGGASGLPAENQEDADLQEALRRSMVDIGCGSAGADPSGTNVGVAENASNPSQSGAPGPTYGPHRLGEEGAINLDIPHVPLVDCIRTRWPRAQVEWTGPSPSIV